MSQSPRKIIVKLKMNTDQEYNDVLEDNNISVYVDGDEQKDVINDKETMNELFKKFQKTDTNIAMIKRKVKNLGKISNVSEVEKSNVSTNNDEEEEKEEEEEDDKSSLNPMFSGNSKNDKANAENAVDSNNVGEETAESAETTLTQNTGKVKRLRNFFEPKPNTTPAQNGGVRKKSRKKRKSNKKNSKSRHHRFK